jgi:hypothetical protein
MLVPDAACPVCASTDHPHLANPSALNDMVTAIRRRRQELDVSLDTTSLRLSILDHRLWPVELRCVDDIFESTNEVYPDTRADGHLSIQDHQRQRYAESMEGSIFRYWTSVLFTVIP